MNEPAKAPNPLARGLSIVVILLVVILILVLARCCQPVVTPEPPDLVIEDETVAVWTTLENRFRGIVEETDCPLPFWNGLLFQLGYYSGAPVHFQSIEILRKEGALVRMDQTDFSWINVVSHREVTGTDPGCPTNPMKPDSAFLLYPHDDPAGGEKRLHHNFVPLAILTFWQGGKGWECRAEPGDLPTVYNRQSFWFPDGFMVEVYKAVQSEDGSWTMEQTAVYEDVESITITSDAQSPEHGAKQDPPWPGNP